jgi:hypothetical protein
MIVISNKPGQLGNMLFLFAHFIARARESDFHISNPAFESYAEYFPSTRDDLFCRYPARRSAVTPSPRLRRFLYRACNLVARALARAGGGAGRLRSYTIADWETVFPLDDPALVASARAGRLAFVRGWLFRDQAAFDKHAEAIRNFFRPLAEHRDNVDALIARAREDADVLVGVHIRHGIIHHANARHYWQPPEKYAEWMGRIETLFPSQRVAFLVCSDVKQDPVVFARHRTTFGNDHIIEDVYSFARCDYLFGPPSTYTMWASFYGNVPLHLVSTPDWEPRLEDFRIEDVCQPRHTLASPRREASAQEIAAR